MKRSRIELQASIAIGAGPSSSHNLKPSTPVARQGLVINAPDDYIDPRVYDVLLSDMNDELISTDVAAMLNVQNLSSCEDDSPIWPVFGAFYGSYQRPMLGLKVTRVKRALTKNVIFLLDTGSPITFMTEAAFEAFGQAPGTIHGVQPYVVNGVALSIGVSHGKFHDVNVLGADFLRSVHAHLRYVDGVLELERPGSVR